MSWRYSKKVNLGVVLLPLSVRSVSNDLSNYEIANWQKYEVVIDNDDVLDRVP
jgi:hypothetical protein